MFARLALAIILAATASTSLFAGETTDGRVRVLLVADTLGDPTGSLGIDLDRDLMTKTLRATFDRADISFTLEVIEGVDVSPANILKYYKDLDVRESDSIVLYYCGHGGADWLWGHVLTTSRGHLYRSELRTAMLAKKARLTVLLTDACANSLAAGQPTRAEAHPTHTAPASSLVLCDCNVESSLRRLFVDSRGVVDITAAARGTVAFGRRKIGGSYFTLALTNLLTQKADDCSTDAGSPWRSFFATLQADTESLTYRNLDSIACQSPEAFSLPQGDVAAPSNVRVALVK
jgi:hypothetical protein